MKNWETAAITGFRSVKAIADEHFNALVRTHFAEYKRGGLFSTMKWAFSLGLSDTISLPKRRRILEENMFDCAANTEAEITEMAARELAPYTVLRAEFIALQTALEQDYRHQLGTHGSTATIDLLEAFLLANKDSIAADLTTGVFSTVTKTLFSTFGRHPSGQNATDQNSIVVEQNCDFALKVMSRTQAYLERMCYSASFLFVSLCVNSGFKTFCRGHSQVHRPRLLAQVGQSRAQCGPRAAYQRFSTDVLGGASGSEHFPTATKYCGEEKALCPHQEHRRRCEAGVGDGYSWFFCEH